jgi:hypothetical protein
VRRVVCVSVCLSNIEFEFGSRGPVVGTVVCKGVSGVAALGSESLLSRVLFVFSLSLGPSPRHQLLRCVTITIMHGRTRLQTARPNNASGDLTQLFETPNNWSSLELWHQSKAVPHAPRVFGITLQYSGPVAS